MIDRPDIDEFIKLVNDLADVQDDLNKMEYQHKKLVATFKRSAMSAGQKTREVENVEYLGNNTEEGKQLDALMQSIFDRKKVTRILWGRIEGWKSQRDLYRTDSYHEVTGSKPIPNKQEEESVEPSTDDNITYFGVN